MGTLIRAAVLATVAAAPVLAQDATAPSDGMTCGEFLALDAGAQMEAMLALRASPDGGPAPAAEGATAEAATSAAGPKLTAMRTSCEGVPDALARDAMIAAHADQE